MINKYVLILNYSARSLVILIGLAWIMGWLPAVGTDPNIRMFGVVFILFGIYRLATFWAQHQEYKRYRRDGEE